MQSKGKDNHLAPWNERAFIVRMGLKLPALASRVTAFFMCFKLKRRYSRRINQKGACLNDTHSNKVVNNNALHVLTDPCNIQCPVCYLQHRKAPKATSCSVLLAKHSCPVPLMELLSCLCCFETSFDRCKPQLYTEVLLVSLEFFLTQILPGSKKHFSFQGKASICAL